MRTSSRCSCSCCGSTTRPTCSSWAAKWQRCTIWSACGARSGCSWAEKEVGEVVTSAGQPPPTSTHLLNLPPPPKSEEHTSELQSQTNLLYRLLLGKKNNNHYGL